MAIDFPDNPSIGDTTQAANGTVWRWDGVTWSFNPTPIVPPNIPPANVTPPSISGTPVVGSPLTCNPGSWEGLPSPSISFQWLADGAAVPNAITNSYTPLPADGGKLMTCQVTATNTEGSAYQLATASGIVNVPPANTVLPAITGTARPGFTLQCSTGTWTGIPAPTFTYQWQRDGAAISGQTTSSYAVVLSDVGTEISCKVVGTNAYGSVSVVSNGVTVTDNASGPGVPAQTVDFGGLTRGDAGDYQILTTGGLAITACQIQAGTNSTRFQVSSTGVLRKASGDNTALPTGPITLNIRVNNLYDAVLTLRTSGLDANGVNLAQAYSVADIDQLSAVAGLTGTSGIYYGQAILMRTGDYNAEQDIADGMWRSNKPLGTLIEPSFYPVPAGHPDGHKGYDLSTGTYFTLTSHAGASPVLHRMRVNANVNDAWEGLRITRITIDRSMDVSNPIAGLPNPNETMAALSFTNTHRLIIIDHCSIKSTPKSVSVGNYDAYIGIWFNSGNQRKIIIQDNHFEDCWCVCNISGRPNDDLCIVGNLVERTWTDNFFVNWGSRMKVNWNYITDQKCAFEYDGGGIHNDCLQVREATAGTPAASDSVDGQVIANVFNRGIGTPTAGAPDVNGYNGEDFQGPFVMTPFPFLNRNWIIDLNLVVGVSPIARVFVNAMVDSFIRGNTLAIQDPGNFVPNGNIGVGRIRLYGATVTGNTVEFNVVEGIQEEAGATGNIIGDNTIIVRTAADANALSYKSIFVDPPAQGTPCTDPINQFAIKAGSAADKPTGTKHGASWYVDYANRELSAPWYGGASGTPPVNTAAPAVTGNNTVGSTLTCATGTWTGNPAPTFTFQWKADGTDITGETASTYVVLAADDAKAITCAVTGTNANGSATVTSNAITIGSAGGWWDTGIYAGAAVVLDFNRQRYAITTVALADIPTATPDELKVKRSATLDECVLVLGGTPFFSVVHGFEQYYVDSNSIVQLVPEIGALIDRTAVTVVARLHELFWRRPWSQAIGGTGPSYEHRSVIAAESAEPSIVYTWLEEATLPGTDSMDNAFGVVVRRNANLGCDGRVNENPNDFSYYEPYPNATTGPYYLSRSSQASDACDCYFDAIIVYPYAVNDADALALSAPGPLEPLPFQPVVGGEPIVPAPSQPIIGEEVDA